MFWNNFRHAVVVYLRANPGQRKNSILVGARALLEESDKGTYMYRDLWSDTRDCLCYCTPAVLVRDSANRYSICEEGVQYWVQQDREKAHRYAYRKALRQLSSVAVCLDIPEYEWIERMQHHRKICRWVESFTPEQWALNATARANRETFLGFFVEVDVEISRMELLMGEDECPTNVTW